MTRSASVLSPRAQSFRNGRRTDVVDKLPIGQSERPSSRWRTTTMEQREREDLHPAPSREAVVRYAEETAILVQKV